MSDTRGIFSLNNIRQKKMLGEAVPVSDVFIQAAPQTMGGYDSGFFMTGYGPLAVTTAEKISYSTDTTTATPSADIQTARFYVAGVASYNEGYTIGGSLPGASGKASSIEKTTFSNDTTAASPVANITNAGSYGGTATGTADVAYINIGFSPGPVATNINKLTYSTDSTANIPTGGYLSISRGYASSAGTPSFAFFIGGYGSGVSSVVDRMIISSETTTRLPSADLPTGGNQLGGNCAAGDQDKCYIYGGLTAPTFANISNVQKLTYSAATTVLVPGAENLATSEVSGTSSQTSGYYGGGVSGGGSYVQKLVFSTETTTTLPSSANLSTAIAYGTAFSSRDLPKTISFPLTQFKSTFTSGPYKAYSVAGNETGGQRSYIDKLDLATDTSSVTAPFVRNGSGSNGMGNLSAYDKGYLAGGAGPNVATITKYMFSTDVNENIPAQLNTSRFAVGASGNNTQGYFYGGQPGTQVSTVEKLTYSTESVSTLTGSPLSAVVYGTTAMGNNDHGYVFGGYVNAWPATTIIQKMNYSTDTIQDISTRMLRDGYISGAANRSDHGYIMGGLSPSTPGSAYSDCQKFSLTSETIIAAPTASLHTKLWAMSAFSNGHSDSYAIGGNNPGTPAIFSTCNKLNYDTDTRSNVPSGNLSSARYYVAGISPKQYTLSQAPLATPTPQTTVGPNRGYLVGGETFAPTPNDVGSSMDRLDFSTDTTTRSTTANMSMWRSQVALSASVTDGYIMAGPQSTTICEKTSFASETTSRLPTADIIGARYSAAGFGNPSAAYVIGGGTGSGATSTGQKLTYSTDTFASVTSANSSVPQRYVNAVANHSNAYMMGGGSPYISSIDKLVYSTDTNALLPGVDLSSVTGYTTTASGNTTAGYASGGFSPSITSKTEKLTYATETNARIPGMDLSVPRGQHGGTSSFTDGFFGAGYPLTSVDKMSYATDTNLGVIPGLNLPVDRYNVNGMSARHNNQVGSPVNC